MKTVFSKLNWIGNFFKFLNLSRLDIFISSILSFFSSLFEGLGVAMMLPVLQFIQKGEAVFEEGNINRFWQGMLWLSQTLNLSVSLPFLLFVTFSVILTRATIIYLKGIQSTTLELRAVREVRRKIFSSYFDADFAFCEKVGESTATNLLSMESVRLGRILFAFFEWLSAVFGIVFYMIVLFGLSWQLTLLAMTTFFLIQVFLVKRLRATKSAGSVVTQKNSSYSFFLSQRMTASKLIRIFKTESEEKKKFEEIIAHLESSESDVRKKSVIVQSQLDPILISGALSILYVGSTLLKMEFSAISVFLLVLLRMFPFSKSANAQFQTILSFKSALDKIQQFIESTRGYLKIQSGPVSFTQLKSDVEFCDVNFSYDGNRPVLSNINFKWKKGQVLALVGQSGSGKSTIVDLLLRLRDPTSGHVNIDGRSLKDYDLHSLRRSIGFVSQDTFLFSDTIYNNIVYGHENITEAQVKRACELSHCQEFVNLLPQGLQARLGDRGASLSGGERQRLCLARALVHDPDILILDEPTSALDSESESYINQTLQALKSLGKTILIIAHRFSTIQEADQILVMNLGVIVASGLHDQLKGSNIIYSKLCSLQNVN